MRTALAALIATLLLATPAAAQTDTTPTIAADGRGTATLAPDIADFSAGVLRRAPTSAAARRSANARVAAVLRVVKARGVADADVRTVGLQVSRERVGRRGHRRVRYTAAQELSVRVRDVEVLGAILDAVANAGADDVGSPEFGFADPSQGRLLATRAALADARKRAEDAAAHAGLRITGVDVDVDPSTEPIGGSEAARPPRRRGRRSRRGSTRGRASSSHACGSSTRRRRRDDACRAAECRPVPGIPRRRGGRRGSSDSATCHSRFEMSRSRRNSAFCDER